MNKDLKFLQIKILRNVMFLLTPQVRSAFICIIINDTVRV